MDYQDVIVAYIREEKDIVGEVAFRQVEPLQFIRFSEENEIIVDDDVGRSEVEQVVERFKEIQGRGAIGIARQAIERIMTPDDDIDLPPELLPHQIKEKRFISGF